MPKRIVRKPPLVGVDKHATMGRPYFDLKRRDGAAEGLCLPLLGVKGNVTNVASDETRSLIARSRIQAGGRGRDRSEERVNRCEGRVQSSREVRYNEKVPGSSTMSALGNLRRHFSSVTDKWTTVTHGLDN